MAVITSPEYFTPHHCPHTEVIADHTQRQSRKMREGKRAMERESGSERETETHQTRNY